jgi:hypothetical protein
VATATAVGLFVDGARLPVYLATQYREMSALWFWILIAMIGVTFGTVLGVEYSPRFLRSGSTVSFLLSWRSSAARW